MKLLSSMIMALSLLSVASSAWGLIEVRGSYQQLSTSGAKDNNDNVPDMKNPEGLSADVVGVLLGFVAGVRYENLTERKSNALANYSAKFTRTSLIAGYRVLDDNIYLGPLVSLGLTSELNYHLNVNSTDVGLKSSEKSTYSIGVEGGYQALGYLVGAEIGYLSAKLGNLKNKNGSGEYTSNGQVVTADMSGVYARIVAGLSF